jgi:hypothetical protein
MHFAQLTHASGNLDVRCAMGRKEDAVAQFAWHAPAHEFSVHRSSTVGLLKLDHFSQPLTGETVNKSEGSWVRAPAIKNQTVPYLPRLQ